MDVSLSYSTHDRWRRIAGPLRQPILDEDEEPAGVVVVVVQYSRPIPKKSDLKGGKRTEGGRKRTALLGKVNFPWPLRLVAFAIGISSSSSAFSSSPSPSPASSNFAPEPAKSAGTFKSVSP